MSGYYDSNQLTDKVRLNPYSIILLDEIEKADAQLLNIFLQVFDAGRLTDARGNVIDFSKTTIVMTSNIGTALFSKANMGYKSSLEETQVSRATLIKSLKKYFSPEFLNRIDEIIVFHHLRDGDIKAIIDIHLREVRRDLEKQGKELVVGRGCTGPYRRPGIFPRVRGAQPEPRSEKGTSGKNRLPFTGKGVGGGALPGLPPARRRDRDRPRTRRCPGFGRAPAGRGQGRIEISPGAGRGRAGCGQLGAESSW